MEQCCDICGNIGWTDSLIPCYGCKSSVQHKYCMSDKFLEYDEKWLCEHCDSSSKPTPRVSSSSPNVVVSPDVSEVTSSKRVRFADKIEIFPETSRKHPVNWEKKVAKGKTKYISVNEAIKLSSGAENSSFSGKVRSGSRPTQATANVNRRVKHHIRSYAEPPLNLLSPKYLRSRPLHRPTAPKRLNLGSPEVRRQRSETDMLLAGTNACLSMEPTVCSTQNMVGDSSSNSWFPALNDLWKGRFNIDDKLKPGKLNLRIQAHPPCQVDKKAYEFSKRMPGILNFEVTPCENLWSFEDYLPDGRDVSLYFFPRDRDSSEDYGSLLESITTRNCALRMLIGCVELLIFSSKLLHTDFHCWRGKHFLWGVFRCRPTADNLVPVKPLLQPSNVDDDGTPPGFGRKI